MKISSSYRLLRRAGIAFYFLLFFLCIGMHHANAQADSTRHYTGYAQVCGKMSGGNVNHVTTKADIILYIEDTANSKKFSIIFPYQARMKMSYDPEKKLVNRQVCITGDAENSEEGMSIVIHSEDQIKIE